MVHCPDFTLDQPLVENQLPMTVPLHSKQFSNTHSDYDHNPQSRSLSLNSQEDKLIENLIRQGTELCNK